MYDAAMQRLGAFFARLTQRYLPDPMALACLLTLVVLGGALVFPQAADLSSQPVLERSLSIARMWLGAVWNPGFLTFALQMCVVLLTGFGLARAPAALRLLERLAGLARSNRGAVLLIGLTSCVGCWINWGLGLILAGVLATRVRSTLHRKGVACQYALIVAAAYSGMMIWHGGLSGSAPLKVATDGVDIEAPASAAASISHVGPIHIGETILSPGNLGLTAVLFIAVPLMLLAMAHKQPKPLDVENDESEPMHDDHPSTRLGGTPADRINHSRVLSLLIAVLIFAGLAAGVIAVRAANSQMGLARATARSIDLNFVNSLFLALGLLLHADLMSYIRAVLAGGQAIVGIVIQFPLYAGIQGVMFGAGLAAAISHVFVNGSQAVADAFGIATAHTFPLATFISAGLVNFFVPSGGGQWIVQGPMMCGAAHSLSLPLHQTVMAIAYGDQLTNMVQPFWAIPLMGMTKVNAREFMGYCALLMILAAPLFMVGLLIG